MNKAKMKLAGAMIAMFLFGGIAGAGLAIFLRPYYAHPPRPEEIERHMMESLDRRLHLTPEERDQIAPIAADFAQQAKAVNVDSLNQISQLAVATDERIKDFLTPEQKVEMDRMTKEWQENFVKHGAPPYGIPPGAPPGGRPGPPPPR